MRVTISSGIGSLLSVMESHVRRCSKLGADAPHHFFRISIFFDHRQSPLATQPRWARSLDLAGQEDPVKSLPASEWPPLGPSTPRGSRQIRNSQHPHPYRRPYTLLRKSPPDCTSRSSCRLENDAV